MIAFLRRLFRRDRAQLVAEAEQERQAIAEQIKIRRSMHREFRPLYGNLSRATSKSIAASLGRSWDVL